ncbi:tRNA adenosine(34) deaminase TadA [Buchnera aphidicola]|uniref:tRNA adenosine(34) deaminase TadA n=1 Tax=Buchnera aphidicola TaxID=9 RepID=UPI0034649147
MGNKKKYYKKKKEYWMKIALFFAKVAFYEKEVPIGSILIQKNKIIGIGWNHSIKDHDPTSHAEIIALRNGGKYLKNYRLLNSTLYVTLEPCLMCLGAILNSRIKTLVIGTSKKKKSNLLYMNEFIFNNKKFKIKVIRNILQKECSSLLKNFFLNKRNNVF